MDGNITSDEELMYAEISSSVFVDGLGVYL